MTRPPHLARLLLRLVPGPDREFVEGDLEEAYASRLRSGALRADAWYWFQVLRTVFAFAVQSGARLGSLFDDGGLAIRLLARRPGFAIVCVLTIGVAIGAATAIFSVVDAVLIRPLAYPDADELVTVRLGVNMDAREDISFSDRGFWYFHDANRSFERFGGFTTARLPLVGDGEPIRLDGAAMTIDAFAAIGVAPLLGRLPTREEDAPAPGNPRVALISEELWAARFASDPAIVGRSINLLGNPIQVIGVMPAAYDFPSPSTDVWYPFRLNHGSENVTGHFIQVVARLRDGVSVEDARVEASSLIGRLGEAGYDAQWTTRIFTGQAKIETVKDGIVGGSRRPLYTIFGTVGVVLLIACGNLVNLLLVRAEVRSRERALRLALGAARWRLVKDVLVESFVIVALGGVVGVLFAWAGIRILVAMGPVAIPRLDQIRTSGTVLLFTSTVVIGVASLVGIFPAIRVAAGRSIVTLRDAGRGATAGKTRHRIRGALLVGQVALTLVLLVGSGLMVRSFQRLYAVDPGFRPEGVITFGLSLPTVRYTDPESAARFMVELTERLRTLPGVSSAAGINTLPLSGGGTVIETRIEDVPVAEGEVAPVFSVRRVTPGYFETMGIPLVEGRTFERRDHEERLGTAIISASLKAEYWPGSSALNRRLQATDPAAIVGVVGDVHDGSLTSPPEQIIYLPMLDAVRGGVRAMTIVVRTASDPSAMMPGIREEVRRLDAQLPITDVITLDDIVGTSIGRITFTTSLLVLGALVALFLGSVGIFGVVSYIVAQRTAEVGIRQALGAAPRQVWGLVMGQAMGFATMGIVLGLVVAAWMRSALSTLIYGIDSLDAAAFVTGSAVMLLVATTAALIPTLRLIGIQPAEAVRWE